jgi:FMN-dependent NADH-azoreductase
MTKLLRIDASARRQGSHSRGIADLFQKTWCDAHPNSEIILRDLARNPVSHIEEATITGFYTPAEQFTAELKASTAMSDILIQELQKTDILLLSTPMYNFTLPSALKAWIDQIVRIGHTFSFSPAQGFSGLLSGKRAVVITATGAAFSQESMRPMDFLTPYLKSLLGFLGFKQVDVITVEGTTIDAVAFDNSMALAQQEAKRLALL